MDEHDGRAPGLSDTIARAGRIGPVLRWVIAALMLLASGTVAVSCGAADDGASGTTTVPSTTAGDLIDHPTGPDDVVLRVFTGGGFVPVEVAFAELPGFSLYGDGRVITQGPVIEIYPGPALPNLQVRTVSEDGIQQILRWADEAGLLGPPVDYGRPGITDVPSTTIAIVADGETYVHEVYALGYEEGGGGLTEAQRDARERVMDFQMEIGDLSARLGDDAGPEEGYTPQALRILVAEADGVGSDPSGIEPQVLDWPLADLGTIGEAGDLGRTAVIAGEDLEALEPLLREANQLTVWRSGEGLYRLALRPLLPDEVPIG